MYINLFVLVLMLKNKYLAGRNSPQVNSFMIINGYGSKAHISVWYDMIWWKGGSFLNQDFLTNPQANSLSCKKINVAVKFKEKIHPLQGSG